MDVLLTASHVDSACNSLVCGRPGRNTRYQWSTYSNRHDCMTYPTQLACSQTVCRSDCGTAAEHMHLCMYGSNALSLPGIKVMQMAALCVPKISG